MTSQLQADLLLFADLAIRGFRLQIDRLEGLEQPEELVDVVFLIAAAQMLRSVAQQATKLPEPIGPQAMAVRDRYDAEIGELYAAGRLEEPAFTLKLRNALLHTDPEWFRDRGLMLTTTQVLSVAPAKSKSVRHPVAGAPDPFGLSILDLEELNPIVHNLHRGLYLVLSSEG